MSYNLSNRRANRSRGMLLPLRHGWRCWLETSHTTARRPKITGTIMRGEDLTASFANSSLGQLVLIKREEQTENERVLRLCENTQEIKGFYTRHMVRCINPVQRHNCGQPDISASPCTQIGSLLPHTPHCPWCSLIENSRRKYSKHISNEGCGLTFVRWVVF
jgi:hypothetical protein